MTKIKTFEDMVRRCTSTTYRRTTIAAIVYKTNQKKNTESLKNRGVTWLRHYRIEFILVYGLVVVFVSVCVLMVVVSILINSYTNTHTTNSMMMMMMIWKRISGVVNFIVTVFFFLFEALYLILQKYSTLINTHTHTKRNYDYEI